MAHQTIDSRRKSSTCTYKAAARQGTQCTRHTWDARLTSSCHTARLLDLWTKYSDICPPAKVWSKAARYSSNCPPPFALPYAMRIYKLENAKFVTLCVTLCAQHLHKILGAHLATRCATFVSSSALCAQTARWRQSMLIRSPASR